MRKEILFAILAGSMVGLIVAFGVWKANRAMQAEKTQTPTSENAENEDSGTPLDNFDLVINSPMQNQVFTEDGIEVTGLTSPNTYVLITSESSDVITMSETGGAFNANLKLTDGLNEITVYSFDNNKQVNESVLVILTDELEEDGNADQTAVTYIGTVTDLTEDSIQLKAMDEEINLISINDETIYIKEGDNSEEISFEDVAIGDFLMALGYTNGNEVLESRRIIVSDPYEPSATLAYHGVVTENSDDEITVTSDGKNYVIEAARGLTTFNEDNTEAEENFDDILPDYEIIAVGIDDEGNLSARTIFILTRP